MSCNNSNFISNLNKNGTSSMQNISLKHLLKPRSGSADVTRSHRQNNCQQHQKPQQSLNRRPVKHNTQYEKSNNVKEVNFSRAFSNNVWKTDNYSSESREAEPLTSLNAIGIQCKTSKQYETKSTKKVDRRNLSFFGNEMAQKLCESGGVLKKNCLPGKTDSSKKNCLSNNTENKIEENSNTKKKANKSERKAFISKLLLKPTLSHSLDQLPEKVQNDVQETSQIENRVKFMVVIKKKDNTASKQIPEDFDELNP